MPTIEQNEDFERLHHLISASEDLRAFLDGVTTLAARTLSRAAGSRIECAVTLRRRKRAVTIAGSSDRATLLDGVEQSLGDGPTHAALETMVPVLLEDPGTDQRWPRYGKNLSAMDVHSALGVPMALGDEAAAALNFFAMKPASFNEDALNEASVFAGMAAHALSIALRIAAAELLVGDLKSAMERRTAIDLACGIIMTQNNCTQPEAFAFLQTASQSRNIKLHTLAEGIANQRRSLNQNTTRTFFDD